MALEPSEVIEALPDSETNPTEDMLQKIAEWSFLTKGQKRVMMAMCEDYVSEHIRSDTKMAEDLGICRATIARAKLSHTFNMVLCSIFPMLVRLKLPQYMAKIETAGDKDWKALKFILEYAGLYVNTSKSLNIHANINAEDTVKSPEQAIDAFLIKLLTHGWNKERICDRIDLLRAQGI